MSRRWSVAVGMLALVAIAAAVVGPGLLQAPTYEATAWLRIRGMNETPEAYAAFRRTQLQILKSPVVLNAALRRPGISGLATVMREDDPMNWLSENLQTSTNENSEVVQIGLRGKNADDVRRILDAVTKAYIEDFVAKDRENRNTMLATLERRYTENQTDLLARRKAIGEAEQASGVSDALDEAGQRDLLLGEITAVRQSRTQVLSEIRSLRADIEEAQKLGEAVDPRRPVRLAILEKQDGELKAELDAAVARLSGRAEARVDIEARRSEYERLQRVNDQLGRQLEAEASDLTAPPRVMLLEEATVGPAR